MDRKVIDIGDLSLWRNTQGETDRKYIPGAGCLHRNFTMDDVGEIITCKDCNRQLSAFWVLMRFQREYAQFIDSLKARAEQVKMREQKGLILKAAQEIERAWRSRKMVPACPHCKTAIMPNDRFGGLMYNKKDTEGAKGIHQKVAAILGI